MTTIQNLTTDIWKSVYDVLQTGTYAISTDNIYSAYNDELIKDVGYPVVIIRVPNVTMEKQTITGKKIQAEITVVIDVYHNSSKNMKVIVDEIMYAFKNARTEFVADNLYRVNVDTTDSDFWTDGMKTIHIYTISVTMRYVGDN